MVGARDRDLAGLERLAQRVERLRIVLSTLKAINEPNSA
jgi:hypothetical protein